MEKSALLILSLMATTLTLLISGCRAPEESFYAKIGNETVFSSSDVTFVCTTSECSYLNPTLGCWKQNGMDICVWTFDIKISQAAADNVARVTSGLETVPGEGQTFLNQEMELYFGGNKLGTLKIPTEMKGQSIQDVPISVSGSGQSREEAYQSALDEAAKIQATLNGN